MELLRQNDKEKFSDAPVRFLEVLRAMPGVREVWSRRTEKMFFTVFLILRAARQNWHNSPQCPYKIEEHCQMARAIDTFLKVNNFNWGSRGVIHAFMRCGLEIMSMTTSRNQARKKEEQSLDGDEDDSNDNLFVKQDPDAPTYEGLEGEVAGQSIDVASDAGFQGSLEDVVEGMQRLNIEVDQTDLLDIFAKLRIKEAKPPRRTSNQFYESDDEDDEDDEDDDKFRAFR